MPLDRTVINRITAMIPPAFKEPVTIYVRKHDDDGLALDSYDSYPVAQARRLDQDWVLKNMAVNPELVAATDRCWEVYQNYMPVRGGVAIFPGKDDYLTDSRGESWVVIEAVGAAQGLVYRLLCAKKR